MIHVRKIEPINVKDTRNVSWYVVSIDDGTLPAQVRIIVEPRDALGRLQGNDATLRWIRQKLNDEVADVPEIDQVAELRRREPIAMRRDIDMR